MCKKLEKTKKFYKKMKGFDKINGFLPQGEV